MRGDDAWRALSVGKAGSTGMCLGVGGDRGLCRVIGTVLVWNGGW